MAAMKALFAAIDTYPEVQSFLDQPKQMPVGVQGKNGQLRMVFTLKDERSVLSSLYRESPLLVQQALYWDEKMPELPICMMISVGGGTLQGDRYIIDVEVEKDAYAHVTSQGATKIHSMDSNYAVQYQHLVLREGAYLEFMPDFTIPHRNARYVSYTDIEVDATATVLYGEMFLSGRKHHDAREPFGFDLLSLITRAKRPDGKLIFAEKILLEPGKMNIKNPIVMGGYDVFANILCITPPESAEQIYAQFAHKFHQTEDYMVGLSKLPNNAGLMLRLVGKETHHIRAEVRQFWQLVREVVKQRTLPEASFWQ